MQRVGRQGKRNVPTFTAVADAAVPGTLRCDAEPRLDESSDHPVRLPATGIEMNERNETTERIRTADRT